MSRIDVKALADSMVARGYPAWATVLHDSFKNDNKPVPSDSETGADEEVDIETLRNAVVREYEKSTDSLELSLRDEADTEPATPSRIREALTKLRESPYSCRDCEAALDRLLDTDTTTVSTGCLDHFFPVLEQLSLTETLGKRLIDAIRHGITGLQIKEIYLNAQNSELSSVLYESLLEKTYLYATFIPGFCSQLPLDLLWRLLDDDGLNISSEDDILDIIKQYAIQSPEDFGRLVSCIRFPFLTSSTYDTLVENLPEALLCPEYQLLIKSDHWPELLPKKQLTRRRHYSSHFHILWHEDSIGVDEWEKMAVSCLKGSTREDILLCRITEELESVVEARGRCTVSGRKVLVGASSGSELWTWLIDTSSKVTLASPEERTLNPAIVNAEFIDATDAGDNGMLISWLDGSSDEYRLGVVDLVSDDDLGYERVEIPSFHGSCRSRLHENSIIILGRTQMTIFDKVNKTHRVFDSPAKSCSNFLDLILISSEHRGTRVYVYDSRAVIKSESGEQTFRDLLLVFDLNQMEWEEDSWDLELDSTSTDLRRHPGPYNGISLFEYRGNVGVLAEMTENGGIRFRMILVHDSGDDEWTEAIADISAVTDGGLGVREVLGLIPVDLNHCVHETVLSRHCRGNSVPSHLASLRKLAE